MDSEATMLRNLNNVFDTPDESIMEIKSGPEDSKTMAYEYDFEHGRTTINTVKIETDIDSISDCDKLEMTKKTSSNLNETDPLDKFRVSCHICQAEAPRQLFHAEFCCLACR